MRVPCCNTASCEECIQNYLLEHDFECPMCESKVPSLDALKVDEELRERVKGYVEGEIERSKKEEEKEEEDKKDVKVGRALSWNNGLEKANWASDRG